jgi:hypothetical protein
MEETKSSAVLNNKSIYAELSSSMSRVERHVPEVVYVEPKVFIPYKQGIIKI